MATMRTNQKIQTTLREIKDITDLEVLLYTSAGALVYGTGEHNPKLEQAVCELMGDPLDYIAADGYLLHKVQTEDTTEYVLALEGENEDNLTLLKMAVCQVRNLINNMEGQYDRNNFIQNILLGNMLTVDIFSYAKRLHVEQGARVVYVIDTGKKSNDTVMELVKNLSDLRAGDFVTSVDEHSVVLVKDVSHIKNDNIDEDLQSIAVSLVDSIHMEAMIRVRVGYGNVVNQIPEIAQSFQEAKMALEVGKVFYSELDTVSYGSLGIGRLIYQLPMSLCDMYIKEVFGDGIPEILDDEESMSTIAKFFENNLNISETARQLYVHRNTLVYRLERIEKAIGLDIRTFDDAMTFKLATMVIAHVRAQREKEYK